MLTKALMNSLWPEADAVNPGLLDGIVSAAPEVFDQCGLRSPTGIAQAMAQFSHECAAGTMLEEDLDYSAAGLMATWPSRFDPARAASLGRQPQQIANAVYDGRMGNRPGSDDGWTYRGRGGAQTTGRTNYQTLGAALGLPLLDQPDLLRAPEHFLACAIAQFIACGCLPFAERDDLYGVTYHLNGGFIGLTERRVWLTRWKDALGGGNSQGTFWTQERLNLWGEEPPLVIDGVFGPMTAAALRDFQRRQQIIPDGRLTPQTIAALSATPGS